MFEEEKIEPIRIDKYGYEAIHNRSIYNGCIPAYDMGFYIGIYLFNGRDNTGKEYCNQSLHLNFGENLSVALREYPYNNNDELQEKHLIITKNNLLYDCFRDLLQSSNPFTLVDNANSGLAKEVVIVGFNDRIELSFINKRNDFTNLNKFAVVNENYKSNIAIQNFFVNCFEKLRTIQKTEEIAKTKHLSLIEVA